MTNSSLLDKVNPNFFSEYWNLATESQDYLGVKEQLTTRIDIWSVKSINERLTFKISLTSIMVCDLFKKLGF